MIMKLEDMNDDQLAELNIVRYPAQTAPGSLTTS